jgi:hypothetical protein
MSKFGATHVKRKKPNDKKRELVLADPSQHTVYANIKVSRGDSRFLVEIIRTGQEISAKARGTLSKGSNKARLQIGDTVLVQESHDGMESYILLKYTDGEIIDLTKNKELVSYKPKSEESACVVFENEDTNNEADDIEIDISAI